MKRLGLLCLFLVLLTSVFVGCVPKETNYQYIYEDVYGANQCVVIYSKTQLDALNLQDQYDLEKYDDDFFAMHDLVLFNFATMYEEHDIRVSAAVRSEHDIKLDICLKSPANGTNQYFDAQISSVLLFAEIPAFVGDANYEPDRVGILVINESFDDVFCSVYYDCRK